MSCTVCGAPTALYFIKKFPPPYLDSVEYVRCEVCGLVMAKTILELSPEEWQKLNHRIHSSYQGGVTAYAVDPQWMERLHLQAEAIALLINGGLLPEEATGLDYGGGDGKLVAMLAEKNIHFAFYDKYMPGPQAAGAGVVRLDDDALAGKTFDMVVTCSVLEHLRSGQELDAIFALVKEKTGVFALHTLVCEQVPKDPGWFYLLEGHSLMYSNKSMTFLYRRHGFKACLYAVDARMWFFFHDPSALKLFQELPCRGEWVASVDFVDYWKSPPYRK